MPSKLFNRTNLSTRLSFLAINFREKKSSFSKSCKDACKKKGLNTQIMIQISRGVYAKNLRDFESQFHYHLTLSFSLNFDISSRWTIILIEIGSMCQFWIKLPTIRGGWKWAQWGSIEPHNFYKMHVLLTVLFILSVHKIYLKLLKTFFY